MIPGPQMIPKLDRKMIPGPKMIPASDTAKKLNGTDSNKSLSMDNLFLIVVSERQEPQA